MTELKNLLALSRNALQVCHYVCKMDFAKPYTIIEGDGKFTANSIGKKILEVTGMQRNECETVLYLQNDNEYRWDSTKLFFVKYHHEFNPVDTLKGVPYDKHKYIDDLWRKADFETARKKSNAHWWLVVQNNKYLCKNKEPQPIDFGERYKKECSEYYYMLDNPRKTIRYIPAYRPSHKPNETDILDKSGYIRWENVVTYQRKAKALRAERDKVAASCFDCSKETAELGKSILAIRSDLAKATTDCVKASRIARAMDKLDWLEYDYDRHCLLITENKYSSVENIQSSIRSMSKKIKEIKEVILGWHSEGA